MMDTAILFSDYFGVDPAVMEKYGAFNISLLSDLPLFIDPFLLFNSSKAEYKTLHDDIISYLRFLKDKSLSGNIDRGLLKSLYSFSEVKQTYLGFSFSGNSGRGLRTKFAGALNRNFISLFSEYGQESVTESAHLEKLCLIEDGVGKDNISDFTTNLILGYLLNYTESFARSQISAEKCKNFRISKAGFNYETESWVEKTYYLPCFNNDYVVLVPKDMLTREDTWINRTDLIDQFQYIPQSVSDDTLRAKINNYFQKVLPNKPSERERRSAAAKTLIQFPDIIDYYIKYKEGKKDLARSVSEKRVTYSENIYQSNFRKLVDLLAENTTFYSVSGNTYKESMKRALFLKHVVEDKDGYQMFYDNHGKAIQKEADLKIAYRFTWFATDYSVDTEVNNGRGPVDTKVSFGARDSTLVEFKLASNSKLERNLQNQVEIYKKANDTGKAIKIIIFFSQQEYKKVIDILGRLGLSDERSIVLIDARTDNKISASNA